MKTLFVGVLLAALSASAASVVVEDEDVALRFDAGRLMSLKEKAGGRELVRVVAPWVSYHDAKGRWIMSESQERRADGSVAFLFKDGGRVVERFEKVDGDIKFTVVESTLKDVAKVIPGYLRPACTNYVGGMAAALSDDASVVCMRSCDYALLMQTTPESLSVSVAKPHDFVGKSFVLVAGPRDGFLPRVRKVVKASGLAYSEAGGPWSLGSPQTRQSYLFANLHAKAADAWIDCALRAGISILHLHCWELYLGHYDVNPQKYPGGLPTLKAVADKVKAAGMNVSMHSLTANISFYDSWVTPVAHSNLIATYTYTLAQPLTKDATEVVVNELPGPKHDVVMTYTSTGNALAIDGELVTYTGIRREKPYAFTGIVRGAYKTKSFDHPAGAGVKYLQQRYFAFYPEVDSPLADELADRLAGVYNAVGSDMIYYDGSEGMKDPYATAKMAAKITDRLDRTRHPPRVEMSCMQPHFWPFRSTIGAWDNVRYGAKPFEDSHILSNRAAGQKANFTETQMGWWQPQMPNKAVRCRFPDETEYFAAKNAGADSAMSLQGINANPGFIPVHQEKAITLIGWYERFRLARAFADDVQQELATLGCEGRLRQDEDGVWTYMPVRIDVNHVRGEGVGNRWKVTAKEACPAGLRIETHYNLSDYARSKAPALLDATTLPAAKPTLAARGPKGLTAKAEAVEDAEFGRVTRLTAFNDTGSRRSSWIQWERGFPGPQYKDLGDVAGVGFWVKGDGSGAVLNVELEHPREYDLTHADHLVKLDFKGWKYVELLFRERDIEEYLKYAWPLDVRHPTYMNVLRTKFVSAVRVLLNDIPVSQNEGVLDSNSETAASRPPSVDIALSDIKPLAMRETSAEDVTLKLNGEAVVAPFEFASGDWAELEDGVWSLYNEKGELKSRAKGPALALKAGANECAYSAKVSDRAAARADVTLFAKGRPVPALKELTDEMKKGLAWEAELPVEWAPAKGAAALPPVKVRPGEDAKLEVTIRGPVKDPVLKVKKFFGWHEWKLASVAEGEVKKFTDGPTVDGVREMTLESSDPASANALVEVVKRYVD